MITPQLLNPQSIAVIGGTDDTTKPGGKALSNLLDNHFAGKLYAVNPKSNGTIQGIPAFKTSEELPPVDLAIMAIPAALCPAAVEILARQKNTKAFIIFSAGFHEESETGAQYEAQIVKTITETGGCLIGPNCIGVMNPNYTGVFTLPIPKLQPKGVDFITASGATAVFIMEMAIQNGIPFSSVVSVGNSAQIGVEDMLEYLDETYVHGQSAPVKQLYLESINKPAKLLKHASSLIRKGAHIVAIKAGSSEAGSRAASSHTGALAGSDVAVDALFRKAGIIRCHSRSELVTAAGILLHPMPKGKNIGIITHAGGPAVMLTDTLSNNGLSVPPIKGEKAKALLEKLYHGSSVANPIDFLATGTAAQLGEILDACSNDFPEIDAMPVIFGNPGLTQIFDAYDMLDKKMGECKKPIYAILPSSVNAAAEIKSFIEKGRVVFPDEVLFGTMLARILNTPQPAEDAILPDMDKATIRKVVDEAKNGYLSPEKVQQLLDAARIPRAGEAVVTSANDAAKAAQELGFPVVMKVVGPVHKSDVGGVALNVNDEATVRSEFERMIKIKDTTAILLQPMLSGTQLFAGAKREQPFGHLVMCGLGGIFIEVLKDVNCGIAPLTKAEAESMIRRLRSYKIIQGIRGQEPVNEALFTDIVVRLAALCQVAPEIFEMDLNPLLGSTDKVVAVDARIRIEKE